MLECVRRAPAQEMLTGAPSVLADPNVAADPFEDRKLPRDLSAVCIAVVARMKTNLMPARVDSFEQCAGSRAIEKVAGIVERMAPFGDEIKSANRPRRVADIHDALERVIGISRTPRLY